MGEFLSYVSGCDGFRANDDYEIIRRLNTGEKFQFPLPCTCDVLSVEPNCSPPSLKRFSQSADKILIFLRI